MEKYLNLHQFISLGVGLMGLSCVAFTYVDDLYAKGVFVFLASIGGSYQDIGVNMACLESFRGSNPSMWLQICHGFFGIGGLIGPFLVYLF